jgi:hypothetical protein
MASKSLSVEGEAPAPARAIPLDALIALLILYVLWGSTYLTQPSSAYCSSCSGMAWLPSLNNMLHRV